MDKEKQPIEESLLTRRGPEFQPPYTVGSNLLSADFFSNTLGMF